MTVTMIFLPIVLGIFLLCMKDFKERKHLLILTGIYMVLSAIPAILCISNPEAGITLFHLNNALPISFAFDGIGRLFAAVVLIVWLMAGLFAFTYMGHEKNEKRYYGFYLIVFGVLMGNCSASNMITYYVFFELLTLTSMPLVLHNQSHEAIMAALKYMFYSFAGAYMALFGLYFLYKYCYTLTFLPGGSLNMAEVMMDGKLSFVPVAALLMVLGFGVKAGMFPMHAWLPTAHPVAPAPASAFLSAIIVKAGVLGIIRSIYYMFGITFLKGTWFQTLWMILSLTTVFMGSMLAYREKVLKKRLAYSTVSQVSYILFGLAVMNPTAMMGSLLHVVAHAFIKSALFLTAGAIIFKTGNTKVDDLRGIGQDMPITIWCYTIVSLGLIGIPPTGGFVSKWYLAQGALTAEIGAFSYVGPAILLVSALLTAGYLLPITMKGFFPGPDYVKVKREPDSKMIIPLVVLAVLTLLVGIMPDMVTSQLTTLVESLFI